MKRNLYAFADKGNNILENHRHMDLKCDEIFSILEHCGVSATDADTAVGVLCYTFAIGVKVGYNARKLEQQRKA